MRRRGGAGRGGAGAADRLGQPLGVGQSLFEARHFGRACLQMDGQQRSVGGRCGVQPINVHDAN